MLQGVLDGAGECGHELEVVFFEPGPWPDELIAAGFRVEVIPPVGFVRSTDGSRRSSGSRGCSALTTPM